MRILAISPHSDDVELGCGGELVRFLKNGHHVKLWTLSFGNPVTGAIFPELEAAVEVLGINYFFCDNFDCRRFDDRRQEILQKMVYENLKDPPDLVFVPNTSNIHQDHEVVTAEARRAFRTSCILGYELPWGDVKPLHMPFYIRLGYGDLVKKCEAVACYESQKERVYTSKRFLHSLATVRGAQTGKGGLAEAFEVLKWVL